jgi:hypothetical protein
MLGVKRSTMFWKVQLPEVSRKLPTIRELDGQTRNRIANKKNGNAPSHTRTLTGISENLSDLAGDPAWVA